MTHNIYHKVCSGENVAEVILKLDWIFAFSTAALQSERMLAVGSIVPATSNMVKHVWFH